MREEREIVERCTGHCCKEFTVSVEGRNLSKEEIKELILTRQKEKLHEVKSLETTSLFEAEKATAKGGVCANTPEFKN